MTKKHFKALPIALNYLRTRIYHPMTAKLNLKLILKKKNQTCLCGDLRNPIDLPLQFLQFILCACIQLSKMWHCLLFLPAGCHASIKGH